MAPRPSGFESCKARSTSWAWAAPSRSACFFSFEAEGGIRGHCVTGVQTCALPISEGWLVRAPGGVNLIGEHVDYLGGVVLPAAIDRRTMVTGRPAVGWSLASDVGGGLEYAK